MSPHAHTMDSKAGASIRSLPPKGAHAAFGAALQEA